jgi:hypothetical protein
MNLDGVSPWNIPGGLADDPVCLNQGGAMTRTALIPPKPNEVETIGSALSSCPRLWPNDSRNLHPGTPG